jgi:hypothetical protein
MRHFYGIYLKHEAVATVLDLIRFVGEPDAIRLSHVTLRGPYKSNISKRMLCKINNDPTLEWMVTLVGPRTFFSDRQSTVVVEVDLGSLSRLVYKPDYPDSLPHITLYDGRNRQFAAALYALLAKYIWDWPVRVGRLREVAKGAKTDQLLIPLIKNFYILFQKLIGPEDLIPAMGKVSHEQRLDLIEHILERCAEATPLSPREQPTAPLAPVHYSRIGSSNF